MKKFNLFLAVIITALMTITSCNKTELQSVQTQNEDATVLQRILDFKADVENPNNLKSNEMISVEDAVWLVEAALNYSYCIVEDVEMYENAEIIIDSVSFDFVINNNAANYQKTIDAYLDFEKHLQKYSENIDFQWKKYFMVDVEMNEGKIECLFVLYLKNYTKGGILFPDLEYDWHTGAGSCDVGRCDGSHPEKNAEIILTNYLNYENFIVGGGAFLINIGYNAAITSFQNSLLYDEICPFSPCIESNEMQSLFNNAKIVKASYACPNGWAISHVWYDIGHENAPNGLFHYYTNFNIYTGEIVYSSTN